MCSRRFLSVVCLFFIWMFLRNHVFMKTVTSKVTQHPEWSDIEHHSSELLQSASHVVRDSLIDVLEEDRRSEQGGERGI